MRSIKCIQDVVDWGLCVGCGACYYACNKGAVSLVNIESIGIRPKFQKSICHMCTECLSICPGYLINARPKPEGVSNNRRDALLIGTALEIWEGHATDKDIRYRAASGGILSALASYCLEKENMAFVLHTGMDPHKPWRSVTVQSSNKGDLLSHSGSRYSPSSPCDSLSLIEQSDRPCVFIGKPCDTAAISLLRKQRPNLDKKLGLVLTFFCAGTPSTRGTLDLLRQMNIEPAEVDELRYRGNGWPGDFAVLYHKRLKRKHLSYKESWHFLQKYRSFRCQLCPDGLGELSDVSCGDAWHRESDRGGMGRSLILVRSQRGQEIIRNAINVGYLDLTPSRSSSVFSAQGHPQLRKEIFGRLLAMRILFIPTTKLVGFSLLSAWLKNPLSIKIKTVLGTLRRLLQRGLWHRNSPF